MAKDVYWFPHDANARNDPKVSRLLMLGGQAAKGSYWDIVEILREAADYRIALEELPAIEYACRFPAGAVGQMLEAGLLEQDDTHLWSSSLNRRMEHMDDIRGKRKTAGSLGGKAKAAARAKQEPSKGVANAKQVLDDGVASAKQNPSKVYLSDQIREDQNREETDAPARDQYTYEGDTDTDSQKIVQLIMQSFPDWDQMAVEVAVMKMRGLAIGFDFVMWQDIIARSIAVTLPEHGPQDYQITISKKINGMKIRARDAETTPGRPQPKEQAHVPDTKPQTDSERLEQARIVAEITGSGGVDAIEKRRAEKEKQE